MRSTLPLLLLALGAAAPLSLASRSSTDPAPRTQDDGEVPTAEAAQALLRAARWDEAASAWGRRRASNAEDGQATFLEAYSLHMAGRLEEAHQAHVNATAFPAFAALAHYNHACLHAMWKQPDPAFAALERSLEAGFDDVDQLLGDTDLAGLHGDARWAAYVQRVRAASEEPVHEAASTEASARPAFDVTKVDRTQLFGFLAGEWDVIPQGMDQPWGVVRAVPAFDGAGVSTVLTRNDTGQEASRATLVLAEDGRWTMVWVDPRGRHAVFKGDRQGSTIVLDQEHADWTDTTSRIVWHDVGSEGFGYTLLERASADEPFAVAYELTYRRR